MSINSTRRGSHLANEESTDLDRVDYTAEDFSDITGFRVNTYKDSDMIRLTRGIKIGTGLTFGEALRSLRENTGSQ